MCTFFPTAFLEIAVYNVTDVFVDEKARGEQES